MIRRISALLPFLLLAACASQPTPEERKDVEKQDFAQEIKEEITVGRTMASKLLGVFGAYKNPKAHQYVNLVGQTLAQNVGRPELKYHFAILDTDEINAYAAPGGYIFVTKGLLKMLKSEAELAVVLGHEIDHVNSRHMYKDIMPKREVSATEKLTRMMSRGASDISGSLSQAVTAGMKMLLEEGLGKDKEYEADRNGVLYASTIGYDSHSMVTLLERIEGSKGTVKISKTHPEYGPRIAALKKSLQGNGIEPGSQTNDKMLAKRFQRIMSSIN